MFRATTTHSEFAEVLHVELVKAKETHGNMDINANNFQFIKSGTYGAVIRGKCLFEEACLIVEIRKFISRQSAEI